MIIRSYKCVCCKQQYDTSGIDLHFRICDSCKQRLIKSGLPSIEEINIKIADLTTKINELMGQISEIDNKYFELEQLRKTWVWKLFKILDFDIRPSRLKKNIYQLKAEQSNKKYALRKLEEELIYFKSLIKRNIISASKRYHNEIKLKEHQRQVLLERREMGFNNAINTTDRNREDYLIRNSDYKRGNLLDNHIRNNIYQRIMEIFEYKCVICQQEDELTLDHFWLSKNEGGNFIMLHTESNTLISNVIVLCRSCNSSKGDRSYKHFFTMNQLEKLKEHANTLSIEFQTDPETCDIASRWYKKKILLLNGEDAKNKIKKRWSL